MNIEFVGFLVLIALQLKHYVVDFPLQVEYQWKNKGTYGHPGGLIHAGSHGLGTFIVLCMIFSVNYWFFALILALFDAITHYHIDWIKMKFGCRDMGNPRFWNHLGLDQMAHQMIYITIALFCVV